MTISFENLMKEVEKQLLPKSVCEQLPPLCANENEKNPKVLIKFFDLFFDWTWYLFKGSPVDHNSIMISPNDSETEAVDFLFFGLVNGFEPEIGYVSLREIMKVEGSRGLKIKRDEYWQPKLLSEVEANL